MCRFIDKEASSMLVKADNAEVKHFTKPDEVRSFPKGKLELVTIGGALIGRATFEPGWKWSNVCAASGKDKELRSAPFPVSRVRNDHGADGRRNADRVQGG